MKTAISVSAILLLAAITAAASDDSEDKQAWLQAVSKLDSNATREFIERDCRSVARVVRSLDHTDVEVKCGGGLGTNTLQLRDCRPRCRHPRTRRLMSERLRQTPVYVQHVYKMQDGDSLMLRLPVACQCQLAHPDQASCPPSKSRKGGRRMSKH